MTRIRRITGSAVLLATVVLLSSCSLFGEKEEELLPKELVKIENQLNIKKRWSTKVGGKAEHLLVGLRPAGDGARLYAASRDGNVVAVDPENGKVRWKTELDIELSAGPGVDEGVIVVAGKDGDIVLLDAASGEERWRTFVGGETLAVPLVKDDAVLVQTIDNRLVALATFDGRQRWEVKQTTPALTMRGASSPIAVGSTVIAGFDNGKLAAYDIDTGDVEWDSMLALPTGRSDLDRLADVDGSLAIVGQDVYAAGYQGRLMSLAAESGQVLWAREISTFEGVSADWNSVYTVKSNGEVIALGRNNGVEIWRNDALLRRDPTLPVPYGAAVVVGDYEGYLHFFSAFDGQALARVKFGGAAISSDPVLIANRLYVQSDDGSIGAFEIIPDRPQRQAPDVAEEPAADET